MKTVLLPNFLRTSAKLWGKNCLLLDLDNFKKTRSGNPSPSVQPTPLYPHTL